MNKRQLTKTFSFSKWFLFFFLAAGLTLSSCGEDYDGDIARLEELIKGNTAAINGLKDDAGKGKYIDSITENANGVTINMSDGKKYEIKNGTNGTTTTITIDSDGYWVINGVKQDIKATGQSGANGADGKTPTIKDGYWWIGDTNTGVKAAGEKGEAGKDGQNGGGSIEVVEDPVSGNITITTYDENGAVKEEVTIPKTTGVIDGNTGIKFIPSYLSQGEAARIHFPVILTDSIDDWTINSYNYTSTQNFKDTWPNVYKEFGIIYAGKADFKYQVNPHSVSFDSFEVLGFTRDTAEIWNYNTNDKKWMLFDKGQIHYAEGNGVLRKDKSYAEGYGIINFRAKDWAFAELSDLNQRTVYSLVFKNGDHNVHSDFIPAKHEVILQRNVYMVKKESDATKPGYTIATAPNTYNYRPFITDEYYRKPQQAYTLQQFNDLTPAQKLVVESNGENQLYLDGNTNSGNDTNQDDRIHVELLYKNQTKDLKEIVLNFFNKRVDRDQNAEWILEENGFDDYTLEFEPVDFWYGGVNQTKRYLNVTKDGIVKVNPNPAWGESTGEAGHTAAVGRTPIVRVKLVAPAEDNYHVVKTAIIKILIVKQDQMTDLEDVRDIEVDLKHIDYQKNIDMDPLFNMTGLSREEFRDSYDYVSINNSAYYTGHTINRKDDVALDDALVAIGEELNQLFLTVKNTSFHADHVVYQVKGQYVPKTGKAVPTINIKYNVRVKYPTVVAPTKTALNWVDGTNYFEAHGRLNQADPVNQPYEMVAVLNDMFDLINYKPYGTKTVNVNDPRAVLSFELVDQHNNASNIGDGHDSGIRLYQTAAGKWEIALEATDKGRAWINDETERVKRIKLRAVVSFNECVDGLYGTCTAGADAHYKYAKVAQDAIDCDNINGTWTPGTWAIGLAPAVNNNHTEHPQQYTSNAGVAPEEGRYVTVINEFEAVFVTPMVFHAKEVKPLYDKYEYDENLRYLKHAFVLGDYLFNHGVQSQYQVDHVVYDYDLRADSRFQDEGWATKWLPRFDIPTPVGDRVHYPTWGDISAKFDDGTELDSENKQKIKIDAVAGTVTWVNNGQDIQKPFTIELPICVLHRWGKICNHSWSTAYPQLGHSVGVIKVRVLPYKAGAY